VRWLRRILECMPELVALLGSVVAIWMPRALLLQQVLVIPWGLVPMDRR
jgi:hypothetical protein